MTDRGRYEDRQVEYQKSSCSFKCKSSCPNHRPYEHPHWHHSAWCTFMMMDLTWYYGGHLAHCKQEDTMSPGRRTVSQLRGIRLEAVQENLTELLAERGPALQRLANRLIRHGVYSGTTSKKDVAASLLKYVASVAGYDDVEEFLKAREETREDWR